MVKSQVLKAEQNNSSILYGKELIFKLYRRLDEGINPEPEICKFLTETLSFSHTPPFAGTVEYRRHGYEPITLGMLHAFIPNEGDAWTHTLDWLGRYFGRILSRKNEIQETPTVPSFLSESAFQEIPGLFQELISGVYLEMISLLGKRTAELHLAMSSETEDMSFAPEPFSVSYQRSLYQSMQSLTKRVFLLLSKNVKNLPDNLKGLAGEILHREKEIMDRFRGILRKRISAMKIRIHGDYHLGQVLYTGNDFFIIDFEGELARTLSDRRLKRSPLRDIASMIRSFRYATHAALSKYTPIKPEDMPLLEHWADLWYQYVVRTFLRSYLEKVGNAPFVPDDKETFRTILIAYLLERAIYELGCELTDRPEWVIIPLKEIKHLLEVI